MGVELLPKFIRDNYDVHEWRHACAILRHDFSEQWEDVVSVLSGFRFHRAQIEVSGGGKSLVSASLEAALNSRGWKKKTFETKIAVDGKELDTRTHEVDCFKKGVALEIEWNNKDPFYQRDLDNFRRLFDLRAVSVGLVVTRSDELQEIFDRVMEKHKVTGVLTGAMIGRKYGASTTHMSKLKPMLYGGSSGGCPVLAIGIRKGLYGDG